MNTMRSTAPMKICNERKWNYTRHMWNQLQIDVEDQKWKNKNLKFLFRFTSISLYSIYYSCSLFKSFVFFIYSISLANSSCSHFGILSKLKWRDARFAPTYVTEILTTANEKKKKSIKPKRTYVFFLSAQTPVQLVCRP